MARHRRFFTYLHVAIAVQLVSAQDQKCYYANGNEAPSSEKPCSSAAGSACCPEKWECLDNGLCHYAADNLWGRYSCTDQKWESPGCASNLCTYDMTAGGGESITQCADHDNQWCCNADATHVNCCKESPEPRPFFVLQDGKAYGTAGGNIGSTVPTLAGVTGSATSGGGGDNRPSATPPPSDKPSNSGSPQTSDGSSPRPTADATGPTTPRTSLQTQVTTGSRGIETLVITAVIPPAQSTSGPSPTAPSGKKKNTGLIVGCAIGIPLALALLGLLFFLLRKRHNKAKNPPYSSTPDPYTNGNKSPDFAGGANMLKKKGTYKSENNVPELGGQGVGPGRPISTIQGKAELGSGGAYTNGAVPYAPNLVGVGGGHVSGQHTPASSWGSAPPGYSPGMNQNAFAGAQNHPEMAEAPDTSVRPGSGGNAVGAGVGVVPQTTEGGRYIPYRPPPGHAAATGHPAQGLQNVPETAELPTVRTPP